MKDQKAFSIPLYIALAVVLTAMVVARFQEKQDVRSRAAGPYPTATPFAYPTINCTGCVIVSSPACIPRNQVCNISVSVNPGDSNIEIPYTMATYRRVGERKYPGVSGVLTSLNNYTNSIDCGYLPNEYPGGYIRIAAYKAPAHGGITCPTPCATKRIYYCQ
jgi:hypothetical protein